MPPRRRARSPDPAQARGDAAAVPPVEERFLAFDLEDPNYAGRASNDVDIRMRCCETGGVIFMYDPNRPAAYRADPPVPVPAHQSGRLRWEYPAAVPYRFTADGNVAGPDVGEPGTPEFAYENSANAKTVRSMEAEGLIRRLTVEEYRREYNSMIKHLTKGIRIRERSGCWIPADHSLANNVYKIFFMATYGLKPVLGQTPHNLCEDREVPNPFLNDAANRRTIPVVNPAQRGFYYRAYVSGPWGVSRRCSPAILSVEQSHLCHDHLCVRPDHMSLELAFINGNRKFCRGPTPDPHHRTCSCMRNFAATVGPNAFDQQSLQRMSCVRFPGDSLGHNIRNASYSTYPRPEQLIEGPFSPGADPARRVRAIEELLARDTGMQFLSYPHTYLDLRNLDRQWVPLVSWDAVVEAFTTQWLQDAEDQAVAEGQAFDPAEVQGELATAVRSHKTAISNRMKRWVDAYHGRALSKIQRVWDLILPMGPPPRDPVALGTQVAHVGVIEPPEICLPLLQRRNVDRR